MARIGGGRGANPSRGACHGRGPRSASRRPGWARLALGHGHVTSAPRVSRRRPWLIRSVAHTRVRGSKGSRGALARGGLGRPATLHLPLGRSRQAHRRVSGVGGSVLLGKGDLGSSAPAAVRAAVGPGRFIPVLLCLAATPALALS
eukprot:6906527-Alexandrium_andersonii.AAC.1